MSQSAYVGGVGALLPTTKLPAASVFERCAPVMVGPEVARGPTGSPFRLYALLTRLPACLIIGAALRLCSMKVESISRSMSTYWMCEPVKLAAPSFTAQGKLS